MDIDKKLYKLKKIEKVDVPPSLFIRIQRQIDTLEPAPVPVQWMWKYAAAAVLVLALNTSIFITYLNTNTRQSSGISDVVNTMQMTTNNSFYNE
jgi:hypothetical protein